MIVPTGENPTMMGRSVGINFLLLIFYDRIWHIIVTVFDWSVSMSDRYDGG